jgi:hypothetical protein
MGQVVVEMDIFYDYLTVDRGFQGFRVSGFQASRFRV